MGQARRRREAAEANTFTMMRFAATADLDEAYVYLAADAPAKLDVINNAHTAGGHGDDQELRAYLRDNPDGALIIAAVDYDMQRYRAGMS